MEETGYQNILLRQVSETVHHHYFAASKGKNRNIEATGLFFELLDDERVEPTPEADEKNKFSVEWISESEALAKVKDPLHRYLFEKFVCDTISTDDGILFDSGDWSGMTSEEAREKMMAFAEAKKIGGKKVNYKLRDWLFSRQRYWGEPIPLIHIERSDYATLEVASTPKKSAGQAYRVEKDGTNFLYVDEKNLGQIYDGLTSYIVCEQNLPLVLPEVKNYEPSGDGDSPLANVSEWLKVEFAPNLTGHRETNTMPQWAGSCWYYLRFMDPHNDECPVDEKIAKYWGEVDSYIGGAEHAVLHLLYARFWHKFLFDLKMVPTDEPFARLRNQGMILGENGSKMSKSKGNVINPDDIIKQYGSDILRLYEMSMADFADPAPWNTKAISGVQRFLEKVWHTYYGKPQISDLTDAKIESLLHKTIKKVEQDIGACKFNTAISALMILNNGGLPKDEKMKAFWLDSFVKLLHPFAPHLGEELWEKLGHTNSIFFAPWPTYDENKLVDDRVTIAVQVNGKLRATLEFGLNVSQDEAYAEAMKTADVAKWIEEKEVKKVIFVPNKLLSIVVAN